MCIMQLLTMYGCEPITEIVHRIYIIYSVAKHYSTALDHFTKKIVT